MSIFQFRDFSVRQTHSALKVGTDAMVLGALINAKDKKKALDIGTGTGVLALMVAQRNPNIHVTAIEKDANANPDARFNFDNSHYASRLRLLEIDFLSFESSEKFDLIVSNPPFYTNGLISGNHELNQAKHVQDLTPNRLFQKVSELLDIVGSFWVIWPSDNIENFLIEAATVGLFPQHKISIFGKPNTPVREVVEFGFQPKDAITSELTIRTAEGMYTEEYKVLTRDFHDRSL